SPDRLTATPERVPAALGHDEEIHVSEIEKMRRWPGHLEPAQSRRRGRPMNATTRREAVAGFTTFLTMSYIIVVNPSILSARGTGMPFAGVMTATVLLAASMTILMGLYAKIPFGVAPGMGLNAFFTFQVVLRDRVPWPVALGL